MNRTTLKKSFLLISFFIYPVLSPAYADDCITCRENIDWSQNIFDGKPIKGISFFRNGRKIFTTTFNNNAAMVDAKNGNLIATIIPNEKIFNS